MVWSVRPIYSTRVISYKVLVLEKRPIPGGGATTEEALPEAAPGF